jgi:hypothetical protein
VHDSSSSDEERDPDNGSDNSSDEDDDPLRPFGQKNTGASNDMSDTFRANTAFVSDDASAWETQEITDSSEAGWVADFDNAGWPGATAEVTEADQEAWKADFGGGDQDWPGSSTEDPFGSAAGIGGGIGGESDSSPFEEDLSQINLNDDADTIDVSEGFTADFGDFPSTEEALVVEDGTGGDPTGAAGVAQESLVSTLEAGESVPQEEVLEELVTLAEAGGEEADLQYLSEMKPMIPEEVEEEASALGSPALATVAEEAAIIGIEEAVSSPLAVNAEALAAEVPEEGLSSSPPTGL